MLSELQFSGTDVSDAEWVYTMLDELSKVINVSNETIMIIKRDFHKVASTVTILEARMGEQDLVSKKALMSKSGN